MLMQLLSREEGQAFCVRRGTCHRLLPISHWPQLLDTLLLQTNTGNGGDDNTIGLDEELTNPALGTYVACCLFL